MARGPAPTGIGTKMYRTERIFIVTALMVVGLGLVLAVSRGIVGAGSGQLSMMLWLMALALVMIAVAGTLWVGRLVEPSTNLAVLGPRLPILNVPIDIIIP